MKSKNLLFTILFVCLYIGSSGQSCSPPFQLSCNPNASYCQPASLSNINCNPFRWVGIDGYWSFVGDGSTITIHVEPQICLPGPPPGDGVSAQLLETCVPVTTLPIPSHNPTDIKYTTKKCKVYTLYLHKEGGCSCNQIIITVSANGGGPVTIPRPLNLKLDGETCVCNTIEICGDVQADCDLSFSWEVNGAPRPEFMNEECAEIELTSTAPVIICLTATLGAPPTVCDEVKRCTTITPYLLPSEKLPLEIVCWENHLGVGYSWYDKILLSSCINPPCTTQVQDRDGCCYDIIQPVLLRNRTKQAIKSVVICDKSELPYETEDGLKWDSAVCNEFIFFKDKKYDCDTSYSLTITVLDPEVIVDRICDNPNEIVLTADASLKIKCRIGIITSYLRWLDCADQSEISQDTFLVITEPGEYCLEMVIDYTNPDGSTGQCIKDIGKYIIEDDDFGIVEVEIVGDQKLCEGQTGIYKANQTAGISTFTWSIPSNNGTIITPNPDGASTIEVEWMMNPGDTGIICLEVNEDCIAGDTCIKVTILKTPSPTLIPDTAICGNQINLGGKSDIGTGFWSIFGNPSGTNLSDSKDINSNVTVQNYGTYVFIWTEENEICEGSDTLSITFNENPYWEQLDTICDPDGKFYHVFFDIKGGVKPYKIIKGSGTIDSTGHFTSDTLKDADILDITIVDSLGCTFSFSFKHQCDCGPIKSGSLDKSLAEACVDNCITVLTNNDHIIESRHCVYMILYRDSILDAVTPFLDTIATQELDSINGNTFCFDSTKMKTETRYYVHYIVTECESNGSPKLDYTCLRYVVKPIIFHEYPIPDVGQDFGICGLDTVLRVQSPITGTGEWTLLPGPGNAIFSSKTATSPVTVDAYGKYTFIWTETQNGCTAQDTIEIIFRDAPYFDSWEIICDSLQENYRITLRVDGGDSTSLSLEGYTIGGSNWQLNELNSLYESPWFKTGDSIRVIVDDQYGCLPDTLLIKHECDCATQLGDFSLNPVSFCLQGQTQGAYANGILDKDDIVVYYLHDGDDNTIGNIIEYNQTGIFSFQSPPMLLNTTYYVTVRVGNDLGNGEVDQNDDCFVESNGIAVTWYDEPISLITTNVDSFYCNVDSILLEGSNSTQNAPIGNLNYVWNGIGISMIEKNKNAVWAKDPGTYSLIVTNSLTGCLDTTEIELFEVLGPNNLDISVQHPDCAGTMQGEVTVDLIHGGRKPYLVSLDNGPFENNLTFSSLAPGIHKVRIKDVNGCTIDTTFVIDVPPTIDVTAREDQYILQGDHIDLDSLIKSFSGDLNEVTIYWINENGDSLLVGSDATLLDSLVNSKNKFTLVVIDKNGCIAKDDLFIFVRVLSPDIFIPNVFTPNGDNINDIFKVYTNNKNISHIKWFRIFTRWGELVYQNDDIINFNPDGVSETGWDGYFNGELLNPGVYVYTVEVVYKQQIKSKLEEIFAGSVTLLD